MDADLAVKQCQSPEAKQGQPVGINRFADDLGDKVISGAEAKWRQPQAQYVMGKPPVDGSLLYAEVCAGQIGQEKQGRKPHQPGEVIPARHVNMIYLSVCRSDDKWNGKAGARNCQQYVQLPGDFQP